MIKSFSSSVSLIIMASGCSASTSLEDGFMELTQSDRAAEEYAEKAKKKETEDMKDAGDL